MRCQSVCCWTPSTDSIETLACGGRLGGFRRHGRSLTRVYRAGDQAGDFLGRSRLDRLVGDLVAAAHDDDAVADLEDVGHAVADQHDRHALLLQALDQAEHLLDLPHRDRGGRLVHQHEPRVREPRARDRHRLALAAGHLRDEVARPRLGLAARRTARRRARPSPRGRARRNGPMRRLSFAAEEDVGGGRQIVAERKVLIDDLDALLARLDRTVEMRPLAVEPDFAVTSAGSCRR